jgi:hypothetical protein
MKTPLQLLIDYLTKYDGMPTVRVIRKCRDLMDIEREQIMDAYKSGCSCIMVESDDEAQRYADSYIEKTYITVPKQNQ